MAYEKRKFVTLIGGVAAVVGAGYFRKTPYSSFRGVSANQNPVLAKSQGGPRISNQPSQGGSSNGGSRVEARPGADDQGRKWRFGDDDDDDFTGSSGASDSTPTVNVGGVESDFDALRVAAVFLLLAACVAIYATSRSGNATSAHA